MFKKTIKKPAPAEGSPSISGAKYHVRLKVHQATGINPSQHCVVGWGVSDPKKVMVRSPVARPAPGKSMANFGGANLRGVVTMVPDRPGKYAKKVSAVQLMEVKDDGKETTLAVGQLDLSGFTKPEGLSQETVCRMMNDSGKMYSVSLTVTAILLKNFGEKTPLHSDIVSVEDYYDKLCEGLQKSLFEAHDGNPRSARAKDEETEEATSARESAKLASMRKTIIELEEKLAKANRMSGRLPSAIGSPRESGCTAEEAQALRTLNETLKADCENLKKENSSLKEALKHSSSPSGAHENEKLSEVRRRLEQAESERDQLKKDLATAEAALQQKESSRSRQEISVNADATREIERLKAELEACRSGSGETSEKDSSNLDLVKLQKDLDALQKDLASVRKERDSLLATADEVPSLKARLGVAEAAAEFRKGTKGKDDFLTEAESLLVEFETLNSKKAAEIRKLKAEIEKLRSERDSSTREAEHLKDKVASLTKQLSSAGPSGGVPPTTPAAHSVPPGSPLMHGSPRPGALMSPSPRTPLRLNSGTEDTPVDPRQAEELVLENVKLVAAAEQAISDKETAERQVAEMMKIDESLDDMQALKEELKLLATKLVEKERRNDVLEAKVRKVESESNSLQESFRIESKKSMLQERQNLKSSRGSDNEKALQEQVLELQAELARHRSNLQPSDREKRLARELSLAQREVSKLMGQVNSGERVRELQATLKGLKGGSADALPAPTPNPVASPSPGERREILTLKETVQQLKHELETSKKELAHAKKRTGASGSGLSSSMGERPSTTRGKETEKDKQLGAQLAAAREEVQRLKSKAQQHSDATARKDKDIAQLNRQISSMKDEVAKKTASAAAKERELNREISGLKEKLLKGGQARADVSDAFDRIQELESNLLFVQQEAAAREEHLHIQIRSLEARVGSAANGCDNAGDEDFMAETPLNSSSDRALIQANSRIRKLEKEAHDWKEEKAFWEKSVKSILMVGFG